MQAYQQLKKNRIPLGLPKWPSLQLPLYQNVWQFPEGETYMYLP